MMRCRTQILNEVHHQLNTTGASALCAPHASLGF